MAQDPLIIGDYVLSDLSVLDLVKHFRNISQSKNIQFTGNQTPHMSDLEYASKFSNSITVASPVCNMLAQCGFGLNATFDACSQCSAFYPEDLDIICKHKAPINTNGIMTEAVDRMLHFFEEHLGAAALQFVFDGSLSEQSTNTNHAVDDEKGQPAQLFPRAHIKKVDGVLTEISYCIFTQGLPFTDEQELLALVGSFGPAAMGYLSAIDVANHFGMACDYRVCSGNKIVMPAPVSIGDTPSLSSAPLENKPFLLEKSIQGTAIACKMTRL